MTKKVKFFGETLGLSPLPLRAKQAATAIFGEEDVPRSKAGLSSLKQLHLISIPLWLGKTYIKDTVIISNLYNHTQTPIMEGWNTNKTQVKDFRGRSLTYNSHNGTDFSIPVGTTVRTAAAGKVVRVVSEFNRGGLKIFIDHGQGLMTCYAHLARALVKVGDVLKNGDPIAISGYSGLDSLITFPFGIPHIHFNVWFNCEPVDPFQMPNGKNIWRSGMPTPFDPNYKYDEVYSPSEFDEDKVEEGIVCCLTESSRERIRSIEDLELRGSELICEMNYYPTRFPKRVNAYKEDYKEAPMLSLPFSRDDFSKVCFIDDI